MKSHDVADDRKQRLMDAGAECLADALLGLSVYDSIAEELVARLLATPAENLKRFKEMLSAHKRAKRFVPWNEAGGFAQELEALLMNLKNGVSDPVEGVKWVIAFYESDHQTLERCDDSSGTVSGVYSYGARELFVHYAKAYPDKRELVDQIFELIGHDDYGVRRTLLECATAYFPHENIRQLIGKFQDAANQQKEDYFKWLYSHMIESLARQIKDPLLFEQTRTASKSALTTGSCVDIAQVYFDSGNARTALEWMDKIPLCDRFKTMVHDVLLRDIYRQLGQVDQEAEAAWRIFRRCRDQEGLEQLVSVIGEDHYRAAAFCEVEMILRQKGLSSTDAVFLLDQGYVDQAETYVLLRHGQLNGDSYTELLSLIKKFEAAKRNLPVILGYRALIDSILKRGYTKAYPYGVRYLKALDDMADTVADWNDHPNHARYIEILIKDHGRKSSFWRQYKMKKEY